MIVVLGYECGEVEIDFVGEGKDYPARVAAAIRDMKNYNVIELYEIVALDQAAIIITEDIDA